MEAAAHEMTGRQATAAPFLITVRCIRAGLAVCLLAVGTYANPLYAQQLIFDCEWQLSSPPYSTEFQVNVSEETATRSDSETKYLLLSMSDNAVWLQQKTTNEQMIAIATLSRSPIGGAWTDTQLPADGTASVVSGGYCIERAQ
jgi:hypothetical protein